MRPVTEKIPKSLIDINGKPFIYYQLKLLKKQGIGHIIICAGYLGKMIEEYAGNGSEFGMNVQYSYDGDKLLGTGGAVRHIGISLPESFFVLYGDSYLDIDYKVVESYYKQCGKKALMTVYKNDGRWDASNVIYKEGKLLEYSKKNRKPEMNYIDYGLGVFNKSVFEKYHADTAFDLAEVYENLCAESQLAGFETSERFYEIGSPGGLEELRQMLQENQSEQSRISRP
jgi:NDP-sugar pyrophosphorylase family protein